MCLIKSILILVKMPSSRFCLVCESSQDEVQSMHRFPTKMGQVPNYSIGVACLIYILWQWQNMAGKHGHWILVIGNGFIQGFHKWFVSQECCVAILIHEVTAIWCMNHLSTLKGVLIPFLPIVCIIRKQGNWWLFTPAHIVRHLL
jgi:hypothetical protein